MKIKLLFLSITLSFCLANKDANSQSFQQDRHYLSFSYGFGNFGNSLIREYANQLDVSDFSYNTIGPLFLKYEYAIAPQFGFGINIAYLSGNGSFNYDNGTTTTNLVSFSRIGYNINMRFGWHFAQHEVIDPYLALGAGYRSGDFDVTDNGSGYSLELGILSNIVPVGAEIALGSRFMFSDNVGAFVEIGVCRAAFQIGITSRF